MPVVVAVPGQVSNDDEIFVPTIDNYGGRWRTSRPLPREHEKAINDVISLKGSLSYEDRYRGFRSALLQRGRPGKPRTVVLGTGVTGQVLRLNDQPLANAIVSIGSRRTRTDASGRYEFAGIAAGRHEIFVDGSGGGSADRKYGKFVVGADVVAGEVTEVAPVYVPRIREEDWIDIPNPLRRDVVVTHPNVPGMEIRIPRGAVLRERDGKLVTRLALIPMPLDRAPMPEPIRDFVCEAYHEEQEEWVCRARRERWPRRRPRWGRCLRCRGS